MDIKDVVVGSQVLCVDKGVSGLDVGAVYTVSGVSPYYVYLKQKVGGYLSTRFEPIPAPPPCGPAGDTGLKYDSGKPQWSLLLSAKGMLAAVSGVVAVLGFGAKKYAAHSWREVSDNERRYTDAMIRHLVAIQTHGLQAKDEESGLLHIDHLNCNGLFLGELARK